MNCELVKKSVLDLMDDIGVTCEAKIVDGDVEFKADFTLTKLKDAEVTMVASCMEDGITSVDFIFNEVEDFNNIFEMVNEYNDKNVFFKAHVDIEDDYFILTSQSFTTETEEVMINFIDLSFGNLISEDHTKKLKPIVKKLEK